MRFYYGLSENYDANYEAEDYIAFQYKIRWIDKNKNIYEPIKDQDGRNSFFVSATMNEDKNTIAKEYYKVPNNDYKLLPILHQNIKKSNNIQRDVFVVYGSSGSGKSTMVNNIAKIYKGLNPNNQLIYISSKNMLIDPSFDNNLFKFMDFNEFMEFFDEGTIDEFKRGNLFDNSLIVFDDLVFQNIGIKKRFYDIITIIINLKRMNYISMMYCIHEVSDYKYTRTLFNEMTGYIFFNVDLKNRSNLILKDYLKLNKNEINRIVTSKSRWCCILTRARCVLTENEIFALN